MEELLKYSESEFQEKFKPMTAPSVDEGTIWTWSEVKAANIPKNRVWTIVETGDPEDENWYALPGYHIVNKIDYVVTEVPWPHENVEAVYFLDDFEKEN
jgi:hypothetical protein